MKIETVQTDNGTEFTNRLISTKPESETLFEAKARELDIKVSDGLLTTYLQEESGGPPRKYYSITQLGRDTHANDRAEYLSFAEAISALFEGDENDLI